MRAWMSAAGGLIGGLLLMTAPALAQPAKTPPTTPKEAWEQDIRDTEAAYATNKFAMLKIDDAVYLKPGQTAWLVAPRPPAGKTAWRLEPVSDPMMVVTYTSDEAVYVIDGKTASFDPREGAEIAIDDSHDVRAQLTQVAPNEIGLRVFSYNQDHPEAKAFGGLSYFPYAPTLVVDAAFKPEPAKPVQFQTSRGWWKQFWRVGSAEFKVNNRAVKLPLYADGANGEGGLSALFTDRTTGKTTYTVGRYMDAESVGAFPPQRVKLDFNYAYNPNCARSPHYNCPYAVDALPVPIEAGEKAPEDHD